MMTTWTPMLTLQSIGRKSGSLGNGLDHTYVGALVYLFRSHNRALHERPALIDPGCAALSPDYTAVWICFKQQAVSTTSWENLKRCGPLEE